LIAIVDDGFSQVVQFSHFSVKEFLTSDRLAGSSGDVSRYHIVLDSAHTILAQACLGVLLRLDEHVDEVKAKDIPLAEYAARHWAEHARIEKVSARIWVAMEYLFDVDKPHFSAWLRVHDMDKEWPDFSPTDTPTSSARPLYYASLCGLHDLVKHLAAKHPEHVNARGGWRVSPLVAALHGKHFEIAELLLQHGADIHVRGLKERTLLHAVLTPGLVDTVPWLLNHGADVNAQQDDLWTPLHLAVYNGQLEAAQILLEHNADVNAQNDFGEVPFHLVTLAYDKRYLPEMIQLLLDHGANMSARANDGWTTLHYSSSMNKRGHHGFNGTIEGTHLLLKHGASIDAEDNEGKTPRQTALAARQDEIAEFLLACGAK
jgi:ankyrin repeat protein